MNMRPITGFQFDKCMDEEKITGIWKMIGRKSV